VEYQDQPRQQKHLPSGSADKLRSHQDHAVLYS
jgi:hypothetical protein